MRLGVEQVRVHLVPRFDVFLGEDGAPCGYPPDERQARRRRHVADDAFLQLNTTRGAGHQFQHALALKGTQMVFGGIGGLEAQPTSNFRTRGRHTVFLDVVADEFEDLLLAGSEIRHGWLHWRVHLGVHLGMLQGHWGDITLRAV